jgi:hypothetical protein
MLVDLKALGDLDAASRCGGQQRSIESAGANRWVKETNRG